MLFLLQDRNYLSWEELVKNKKSSEGMKFSINPKKLHTQTCWSPARVENPPPIIFSVHICAVWNSSLPGYHIHTWVKTHVAELHITARPKDGLVLFLPLPTCTRAFVFKKTVTFKHFEKITNCLIIRSHLRSTLCANSYIWLHTVKVPASKELHSFPLFPWELKWNCGILFITVRSNSWCCA